MKFLLSLFFVFTLYGCANTSVHNAVNDLNDKLEQDGSPYRWTSKDVNGGVIMEKYPLGRVTPTVADPTLRKDIEDLITKAELGEGKASGKIIETRLLKKDTTSITETWIVERVDGQKVAYTIKMTPAGEGVDINLRGPW
ncbi:MAG: hypothetical protein AAF304_00065 [Pseudomonadota bacterium]